MANSAIQYDPAAKFKFTVRDVEYRRHNGEPLLAMVYEPVGEGPFPAVIEIHGGAWNSGDRTNNPAIAEGLASSGVVVASIDFRMGGKAPFPSSLEDINFAIRWLKDHAAQFHADASTIGGLGVSSGGHLILLSAMRPDDPRFSALLSEGGASTDASLAYVITCWGVLDPYGRYLLAQSDGRGELVENHDQYFGNVETQQEGNPLMMLERGEKVELVPTLLIQGTADVSVPSGMVEKVADLYQKAGADVELALFDGMPHGIAGWSPEQVTNMLNKIRGFISQQIRPKVTAGS